ncbi:hypothetical protein Y032_0335g2871 [Ancylostoma ceylanicum]|uniref:Secreted protein n=1 Tax=Ancylostoma ceylanicum TaxID=53326 RepID=A0A016RZE3_9BILA|nr:hypothetical protein Y032_0335g2871 [Ancylostoma ceylanicum]
MIVFGIVAVLLTASLHTKLSQSVIVGSGYSSRLCVNIEVEVTFKKQCEPILCSPFRHRAVPTPNTTAMRRLDAAPPDSASYTARSRKY